MGVIQHMAARKIMMKDPEQSLQLLDKAENLYREAMRRGTLRKEVAINQQILLNDRKKAEEIIKNRKEMQEKRNEARQKTEDALNKQKQTNSSSGDDKKQKQNEADQKNTRCSEGCSGL